MQAAGAVLLALHAAGQAVGHEHRYHLHLWLLLGSLLLFCTTAAAARCCCCLCRVRSRLQRLQ